MYAPTHLVSTAATWKGTVVQIIVHMALVNESVMEKVSAIVMQSMRFDAKHLSGRVSKRTKETTRDRKQQGVPILKFIYTPKLPIAPRGQLLVI